MENKEYKTPSYIRKASENYRKTRDIITLRFPKGQKERIEKAIGKQSMNDYITSLVYADLERLELLAGIEQEEPDQEDNECPFA